MLYNLAFLIFSIVYLPTLLFKGKLHGDFPERFGIYGGDKLKALGSGRKRIWVEAVSVGEVSLCRYFIPLLKKAHPDKDIVISTVTKTGNDLAKKLFSGMAVIIYFPLDFSFTAGKAIALINPCLYIMIETEIWPNVLKILSRNKIPSVLINGRISDRSIGKYRLVRPFLKGVLRNIGLSCMQSELDAGRIIDMGAPRDKVRITGTMKFDLSDVKAPAAVDTRNRLNLGPGDKLFVAGSTHEGEEEILLEVYKKLSRKFPGLRLLIAPRHVDRAGEIEKLVRRFGVTPVRVSSLPKTHNPLPITPIFILDTIGQLNDVYAVATVVFMGGSLVKHGGQNPIEPAVHEKAILFGPHMFNFRTVAALLLEREGALQVKDKEELSEKVKMLLEDEGLRASLGHNAGKAVLENRGATEKNLAAIREILR